MRSLADAFREANEGESLPAMLELYHTEGTDERTLNLLKIALQYELGLPIARIEFEPLTGAPEERIDFEHDGRHYGPTLPPSHRMRVVYDVEDGFTSLFTIGRTAGGDWRIICAKPLSKDPRAIPITAMP